MGNLLTEDFQARMAEATPNPGQVAARQGSYMNAVVPPVGFEPTRLSAMVFETIMYASSITGARNESRV